MPGSCVLRLNLLALIDHRPRKLASISRNQTLVLNQSNDNKMTKIDNTTVHTIDQKSFPIPIRTNIGRGRYFQGWFCIVYISRHSGVVVAGQLSPRGRTFSGTLTS